MLELQAFGQIRDRSGAIGHGIASGYSITPIRLCFSIMSARPYATGTDAFPDIYSLRPHTADIESFASQHWGRMIFDGLDILT